MSERTNSTDLPFGPPDGLEDLSPYRVPRHPAPTDLVLASNEGPAPELAVAEVVADNQEAVRRYPDPRTLEACLAERFGVDAEQVLVTAGAGDALFRAIRSVAGPGRRVVVTVPTFEMVGHYVRWSGAEPVEVPWEQGPYPVDRVLGERGEGTVAILVVSPNNPTGAAISGAELRRLLDGARERLVIVDQVYAEYADQDLAPMVLERPNAILVGSLSKAWGLAGLRVGFAVGPAPVMGWLRAVGQPYAVSGLSLCLAVQALSGRDGWVRRHVRRVRKERQRLYDLLAELGQRPRPSQANFVLAEFEDSGWVAEALAGLGIAVRRFAAASPVGHCLRITCPGGEAGWRRLEHALRTALAPEALLLDMDGVLADVSRSYRQAIRLTAASYGVELSPAEIDAAKRAGDANNDWRLTRRLLAERGVEAPLAEITRRFEDLYQGSPGGPGLCHNERLIPDRRTLERLAGRLPLAVVSGRPRADAQRFLDEHGLSDLFAAVIAMEDGPAKPHPSPVRQALERLGVRRAWMVGDTPDDAAAARGAGAVPLGVVAPDDSETTADELLRAGAARVLNGLEELVPLVAKVFYTQEVLS
jgi:histidinol-phosphate aminotransferase